MRHVAQIIRHEGCQDTFFCSSTSFHPPLFKLVSFTVCAAHYSCERSWNIPESHVVQSVPARRLRDLNTLGHVVHPCCTLRWVNETYETYRVTWDTTQNAANIARCRSRQSFHTSPPRTELNMGGNHTRTQIPIQKRSVRRATRHVLRTVQRPQRFKNPMIIRTQLSTARRQIWPNWWFHHVHNLPLQCGSTPIPNTQFVKLSNPKGTGHATPFFCQCHSSCHCCPGSSVDILRGSIFTNDGGGDKQSWSRTVTRSRILCYAFNIPVLCLT